MDLEAEIRLYEQARKDAQRGEFTVAQVEWCKKLLEGWQYRGQGLASNGEDEGL